MNAEKLLSDWLIKAEGKTLSEVTLTNYKWSIKAFLTYFQDKESPSEITLEEFKTYLQNWESVNTQCAKINSVKSFYRIMEINSMDLESFDKPKRMKKQPKKIDAKFLMDAINEIDNRKHKAIIALAFSTGMWLGEIINLKLVDIDLANNLIIVRKKDNAKSRIITISDQMKDILVRYVRKYTPVEYLFNGQSKAQYGKESALNAVQKAIGLGCNFHIIRNTHIYALIESGNDLKEINRHLGASKTEGVKRLNFYKKHSANASTRIKLPM